jgi:pimeloyl-ACP methyl ester carboxylesterase
MTIRALILSVLAAASTCVHAQSCPDAAAYAKGREVVADLGRIVAPGGVQEQYKTRIGGVEQWVNVRGQDRDNPMILFVHGGPASPLIPRLWQFQRPFEEFFTIANYDQRASGKTFREDSSDALGATLKIERYADDAIELAEYLKKRYGKRKLVLMGHSWGTIVSMRAALKRPDLFYAYVGIGQVINVRTNEKVSYDFAVAEATRRGNTAAVEELKKIAPYPGDTPITRERIIAARKWAQHYGGLTAYRESSEYFYDAPFLSPEYDIEDACAIDRSNVFTLGRVLDEFLEVDFSKVAEFPIPVVMFMGRHDYTTPSQPTDAWLAQVKAPAKHGVWFEHSSHMVPWEEPGKTLVSLLQYVRPLAAEKPGAKK